MMAGHLTNRGKVEVLIGLIYANCSCLIAPAYCYMVQACNKMMNYTLLALMVAVVLFPLLPFPPSKPFPP